MRVIRALLCLALVVVVLLTNVKCRGAFLQLCLLVFSVRDWEGAMRDQFLARLSGHALIGFPSASQKPNNMDILIRSTKVYFCDSEGVKDDTL
jgi:hypothetical protein